MTSRAITSSWCFTVAQSSPTRNAIQLMTPYQMPEATYLAWLDCRDLGLGDNPSEAFLEQSRVALNSGLTFGAGGEGHVRLNMATSPEILEMAITRMAAARG